MAVATLALVGCGGKNNGNNGNDPEDPKGPNVTISVLETTDLAVSVNVEISDSTVYYVCSIIPTATIASYTNDSLMKVVTANVTKYLSQYTPEYLVKNGVLFQGNKELTASTLTPSTEYAVVVITYDVNAKAPKALFKTTATTKAAIDHFKCTCDSAAYVTEEDGTIIPVVYFTITPDDNKMYYVPVFAMKSGITGDVTTYYQKYLSYVAQQGAIAKVVKVGKSSIGVNYAGTDIKHGDEVSCVVAGINTSVQLVTGVQRFDFKVSFPISAPARRHAPEAKVAAEMEVPFGTPMVAL